MSLRQRLLGSWVLQSYLEQPKGQETPNYPLGADARGMLIYSPDGYMSALLMRNGRRPFASGDWFRSTADELSAASAFIAYSGSFVVDEASHSVAHHVDLSFFPNWVGQSQIRLAGGDADDLILTPTAPILSGGDLVIPQLRWKRSAAAFK